MSFTLLFYTLEHHVSRKSPDWRQIRLQFSPSPIRPWHGSTPPRNILWEEESLPFCPNNFSHLIWSLLLSILVISVCFYLLNILWECWVPCWFTYLCVSGTLVVLFICSFCFSSLISRFYVSCNSDWPGLLYLPLSSLVLSFPFSLSKFIFCVLYNFLKSLTWPLDPNMFLFTNSSAQKEANCFFKASCCINYCCLPFLSGFPKKERKSWNRMFTFLLFFTGLLYLLVCFSCFYFPQIMYYFAFRKW